jgi:hypothetical protein
VTNPLRTLTGAALASDFLWRPSERADEGTTHPFALAEAGRVRHPLERVGTFFEHHVSDFDSQGFDGLCRAPSSSQGLRPSERATRRAPVSNLAKVETMAV